MDRIEVAVRKLIEIQLRIVNASVIDTAERLVIYGEINDIKKILDSQGLLPLGLPASGATAQTNLGEGDGPGPTKALLSAFNHADRFDPEVVS